MRIFVFLITSRTSLHVLAAGLLVLLVAGCGSTPDTPDAGPSTFKVGGAVSGLRGAGLTLQNNGGDDLSVSANGAFQFNTAIVDGSAYAVTVKAQPTAPSQTCVVTGGAGSVAGADVTSVQVSCATDAFAVGGTLSGLAGGSVVLQDNGGDNLTVSSDGAFTFPTKVPAGSAYAVTVKTQPTTPPQTCTVSAGTGTIVASAVTTVRVACARTLFKIGGTVTGLRNTLVLQNNLGDDLTLTASGTFQFATGLQSGAAYAVTVKTRPAGQVCAVTASAGTVAAADVTTVAIACADVPYFILTGTPVHTTVFNTISQTYKFPNNLTNSVWNRQANMIVTGEYSQPGYWAFAPATNGYVATPNNDTTGTFTRLVQIPATNTVVLSKASAVDGVGPGAAASVQVATISPTTGLLSGKAAAVFSDGFAGSCTLHSSSATELLCLSSATTIRRYSTTAGSPNLTYQGDITLSQALPAAALCTASKPCYGSTFAFDGAYLYFASDQGSSANLKYEVYTAAGAFVATDTAAGSGAINGCYFDWSVGRYSTHDGFGNRVGATVYASSGGNSDSHSFGAIDTIAHTLP